MCTIVNHNFKDYTPSIVIIKYLYNPILTLFPSYPYIAPLPFPLPTGNH